MKTPAATAGWVVLYNKLPPAVAGKGFNNTNCSAPRGGGEIDTLHYSAAVVAGYFIYTNGQRHVAASKLNHQIA
jgi:hypothetical protein